MATSSEQRTDYLSESRTRTNLDERIKPYPVIDTYPDSKIDSITSRKPSTMVDNSEQKISETSITKPLPKPLDKDEVKRKTSMA